MSLSQSGNNELETCTVRTSTAAGVTNQDQQRWEASEDREVHFVYVSTNQENCITEVSFSSSMTFNQVGDPEEVSSGVLAAAQDEMSTRIDYSAAPPLWDAGEEIHVSVDNAGSGSALGLVIIGYKPIGEFRRERLRNR